jgi:hypothetical protein
VARFAGVVGYGETVEKAEGVWEDVVIEKRYFGDVVRTSRKLVSGEKVNDDLTVGNTISVVADAYANERFFAIRYVRWAGVLWEVTNVDVEPPRLLLRLGGVYNGVTA